MRQVTLLEVVNHTLLQFNEKPLSGISSTRTRDQQVVSAYNMAVQYLNTQGSFWWDSFMGTFLPVDNKLSYQPTPACSNFMPNSRDTTASIATLVNVTLLPKSAASYDDTYNLAKATATGANPSILRTTVGSLSSRRVSASVWIRGDATLPPGDITLTLSDDLGSQATTKVVTNDGQLQRYGISAYLDGSRTMARLKVSWANATGILYIEGWQVEDNDWPSENIINAQASAEQLRQIYVDPLRISGIAPYKYNTRLNWSEMVYYDPSLRPFDHTNYTDNFHQFYSAESGYINLVNVDSDTNLVYQAKRVPPVYNSSTPGTEVVLIPEPELWTVIRGIVAFLKQANYDVGANSEVSRAMSAFGVAVEDMVNTSKSSPAWSFLDIISPKMMR